MGDNRDLVDSLDLKEQLNVVLDGASNRADSLAPTKDDSDVDDLAKQVNRIDVQADTVVTPTKLTLLFSKDTPSNFTDYFPKSAQKFLIENSFVLGRGDDANVVLNGDTMSRFYGEIRPVDDDVSAFVLKNVSQTKLIEVLYSKGKKRMSHKLKYGEKLKIQTNYILKFHTLEFRVVVEPGDVSSDCYEVEMTSESPRESQELPVRSQPLVVNTGQINKLYMANHPVDTNSGPVHMSMSTGGHNVNPMSSVGPNMAAQFNAAPARFQNGQPYNQGQPGPGNIYPGLNGHAIANPNYQIQGGYPMPNPGYQMNAGYPMGHGAQFMNNGYPMGNGASAMNMYGHPMNTGHTMGNCGYPMNLYAANPHFVNTGYPVNPMNNMGYPRHHHPVKVNSEDLSSFCPTPQERRSDDQLLFSFQPETESFDDLGKMSNYDPRPRGVMPAQGSLGGRVVTSVAGESGSCVRHPIENSELPDPIARCIQKADP